MDLLSYFAIFIVSISTLVYWYFKVSFSYWKNRNVPHVEPSFPFGNVKGLGTTMQPGIVMQNLYNKLKGRGKFGGFYFFTSPQVILLDLDLIKNVLIKDFNSFNDRRIFYNEEDEPLSAHLFALDGTKWRSLRTKVSPTFTSNKMKFMFPTVVDVGERFRQCLLEIVKENDELDIKELLARFTTDVIGTCAFGIECNSLKDPNAEFRNMGRDIFGKPRHSIPIVLLMTGFKNFARMLGMKTIDEDVSQFFMKVVKDTVEYREKNNVSRNDFMDLLIKLKNEETDEKTGNITFNQIAAQAFAFFLAGFETSSTALSFCLYELALNPHIQTKTRNEIQRVLKKHDNKLTYEAMMEMSYIDQVVQETLRQYPPVSNLTRNTVKDYEVPGTQHVIKKNTAIFIPVYGIQHDPEYYPNPDKFDPNRFSNENVQKRHPMTWLPFGDGPRNCIGLRFGMMQARVGLITLLNNFEFSPCSKTPIPLVINPSSFVFSSEDPIYLKFKAIKSS